MKPELNGCAKVEDDLVERMPKGRRKSLGDIGATVN